MKPWKKEFKEYYNNNHARLFRNPMFAENMEEVWNAAINYHQKACICAIKKISLTQCSTIKGFAGAVTLESAIRCAVTAIKKVDQEKIS